MKPRRSAQLTQIAAILTTVFMLATLSACFDGSSSATPSVHITPNPVSVGLGGTTQLTANVISGNQSQTDVTSQVSWNTSDAAVASVDAAGKVTGIGLGTATISAVLGSQQATATVTVTNPSVVSLAVTPASASLAAGTTQAYQAIGTLADATTQDFTSKVTWSSSDSGVATIGSDGTATAVRPGDTTITGQCATAANCSNTLSATATLHVTAATLTAIAVAPRAPNIPLGTTLQLAATGTYSDQSTHDLTSQVTWSSATPSVATVSPLGLATSSAIGTSSVTAALGGTTSAPAVLTVNPATLTSIAITPTTPSVGVGLTQQLTAIGTYSDQSTQDLTATVSWISASPASATISSNPGSNGLATGVAVGTTQVTATLGNVSSPPTTLTIANFTTTLSLSASSMGLSVSGTPRKVSITNTGSHVAQNVTATAASLPAGTTLQSTCAALSPSATCTLTVTPGATPNFAAGDTNPTADTVTIAGSNTNTLTLSVAVLTYGSVYQGGYVFSIDDSTSDTLGIGGTVMALTDQSPGIAWAPDLTRIFAIDETSTATVPSPAAGQMPGMAACQGGTDGECDTNNIVSNYSASQPPANPISYAAGLCSQTISGFADWYLPAVCEVSYDGGGAGSGCGTQANPTTQNILSNLLDAYPTLSFGLSGNYWTATEVAANPQLLAWAAGPQAGNSFQFAALKVTTNSARCVRHLTP